MNSTPELASTYGERYSWPCSERSDRRFDTSPRNDTAPRTAVVLRAWDRFVWTEDDIRNVQALITELAQLGDEYSVHILLQVTDDLDSAESRQKTKDKLVPVAFRNITELWTTSDSRAAYPAVGEYE